MIPHGTSKMYYGIITNNDMGDFNNDFNFDFSIMNKEELIALIDAKIAGQGNQIDLAGVLAGILKAAINGAVAVEVADNQLEKLHEIPGLLDSLQVGDKVVKVTGTDKHLYLVTYKATTGGGIVLTYNACGYGESIAYDRTESGWAFNSKDVKTYGD